MRIDPPPSLACAIGNMPPATAAAAPPLEPPGVRSVSHGLRLMPKRLFSAAVITPKAGVLVRAQSTKPASTKRVDDQLAALARALGRAVRAVRNRPAGDRRQVLDRHRHAEKRRGVVAVGQPAVGLGRGRARLLVVAPGDAFSVGLSSSTACEAGVEQLDRGDLARAQRGGELQRGGGTGRAAPCGDHTSEPVCGVHVRSAGQRRRRPLDNAKYAPVLQAAELCYGPLEPGMEECPGVQRACSVVRVRRRGVGQLDLGGEHVAQIVARLRAVGGTVRADHRCAGRRPRRRRSGRRRRSTRSETRSREAMTRKGRAVARSRTARRTRGRPAPTPA